MTEDEECLYQQQQSKLFMIQHKKTHEIDYFVRKKLRARSIPIH